MATSICTTCNNCTTVSNGDFKKNITILNERTKSNQKIVLTSNITDCICFGYHNHIIINCDEYEKRRANMG